MNERICIEKLATKLHLEQLLKRNHKIHKYEDIVCLVFDYFSSPIIAMGEAVVSKEKLTDEEYYKFITTLKQAELLKWKKRYHTPFLTDGWEWSIIVTFEDGSEKRIHGDIKGPKGFGVLYKFLEDGYIVTTRDEDETLNEDCGGCAQE